MAKTGNIKVFQADLEELILPYIYGKEAVNNCVSPSPFPSLLLSLSVA